MGLKERFWSRVDISESCWEWTAVTNGSGYGQIRNGGKNIYAHRYSYSLAYGDIPDGMFVCHHCDNPGCVRPSHLFLGTHVDNMQDSVAKGRARQPYWQGEDHPMSTLIEDDVHEIRRLHSRGITQTLLAKMWGVGQPHISSIVLRKLWAHI